MAYDLSNISVLVVESTREMYQLFKTVLTMLGTPAKNIYSAYSSEEGFERFVAKRHDIVITDWLQSPDKGIELITNIRRHPTSPNIYVPIIMTAGSGHYTRVVKSRDAGVTEYLVKPFSAADLAQRFTRVIEKPRAFVVSKTYVGPERRAKTLPYEGPDRRQEKLETVKA